MSDIEFTVKDRVAVITLNRPQKLNTVTGEMAAELAEISKRCNADSDIRAVILTGSGEKAFCAGSDIKDLDNYETAWIFRNRDDYCDTIRKICKPVICAVNGYAFGGGLELCLNSDIRLASENASFCAAEIKLGWIGGGGVSYLLSHNIGASNTAYMLMTGDPIGADKALDWKLVSRVYPSEELMDEAEKLALTISERAPIAAQLAKDNIRAAYSMPIDMAIRYERDLQTICISTEDAEEGRNAFKEKRQPDFKGK